MPSSNRHRALGAVLLLAAGAYPQRVGAQQFPQGFAVERLYLAAPGAGWLVMDALDMHGGLGGAMSLSVGYANNPLRVTDGSQRLAVISDQGSADFGFAATWDRWRFYLDLDIPLATSGESGMVGGYSFTSPSVNPGSNPDWVSDSRLGVDVRFLGGPASRFRLGAGAQLIVPNGSRSLYDSDGTFRGMVRVLFAGDVGLFTYAGQVGVHIRPLDDAPALGSPHGSELLFGVAGGAKLPVGRARRWAVIVGPELFGATAFRAFFGLNDTALEGLISGRIEGTADDGMQLRIKLGGGAGIDQRFGAPAWRAVIGIEVFGHRAAAMQSRP